jgi:hypothetical protein
MAKLTTEQLAKAARIFMASNLAAAARIAATTQAEADFMETTIEELQLKKAMAEIEQYARDNNRDPMELKFSLAADGFEEYERMLKAHQEQIAKTLGTD